MTAFDDVLADFSISGAVLLNERYASPWAIEVPDQAQLGEVLDLEPGYRIVPFHMVLEGQFELLTDGIATRTVEQGEMAICTGGRQHCMRRDHARSAVSLGDILQGRSLPNPGNGSSVTELLCGVFILRAGPLNPLLAALPPVLFRSFAEHSGELSVHIAAALIAEFRNAGANGSSMIVNRLLETMCIDALRNRDEIATVPPGFLAAIADSRVLIALDQFHANPEQDWSVAELARLAALSRSRFAGRFRAVMGMSVMSYLTRWRINRACNLLVDPSRSVELVAEQVGYAHASSFCRSFARELGQTPAQWRSGRRPASG